MLLFVKTLCSILQKLVGSATKSFIDMMISEKMIENIVKSDKINVEEKKEGVARKKGEAQTIFLKSLSNKGYALYPTYPNYPSYYPIVNNITPTPYLFISHLSQQIPQPK